MHDNFEVIECINVGTKHFVLEHTKCGDFSAHCQDKHTLELTVLTQPMSTLSVARAAYRNAVEDAERDVARTEAGERAIERAHVQKQLLK